jgi:endonuclease-3
MKRGKIELILELLSGEYGNPKWISRQDPVSELIQTILSQNTSDLNSGRAFKSLKSAFKDWGQIASARKDAIADSIRIGGLAAVKASYIKQSLEQILARRDGFNLDFLYELPLEEAREWLMQLPGVGMKTASCVLLFSLGMPALPVDTHVYRVAKRLGLLDNGVSVKKAHALLEGMVQKEDVYRFHIHFIRHGRTTCKAQRPLCRQCVLRGKCRGASLFLPAK